MKKGLLILALMLVVAMTMSFASCKPNPPECDSHVDTDGDEKCDVCGDPVPAEKPSGCEKHDYAAVVTAPTCAAEGYTTYTCSACGDSYVGDKTDKLVHVDENGDEKCDHGCGTDMTKPRYEVSFNTDGAGEIDSLTVKEGESIAAPTAPEKTGYTFAGWYIGDAEYDFTAPVTANVALVAKWQANTYSFTFGEAKVTVTYGQPVGDLPKVPDVEGKKNGKWVMDGSDITSETIFAWTSDKIAEAVYEDIYYTVTLNYSDNSKTVEIKHGSTLSAEDLSLGIYPFAALEWKLNGEVYDLEAGVKGDITLTAVLASYKVFESSESWKNSGSTTSTTIEDKTNPENTILQFTTAGNYGGVYTQNLNFYEDFSDVSYIYLKVRSTADTKIILRFFKENNAYASTYMQSSGSVTGNGKWHIVRIDLDSLTTFSKEEIKLMLVMSSVAATVEIDDIYFAREEIEIELPEEKPVAGGLMNFDFNDKNGWYFSGTATSMAICDDDNGNSILSGTIGSWGSVYVKHLSNLSDLNYVYVKVKTSTALQLRLYGGEDMSASARKAVTGKSVGTTTDGYTVLMFDLTEWDSISSTNGNFDKSDIQMLALVRNASGSASYDIDMIVLSANEITFE